MDPIAAAEKQDKRFNRLHNVRRMLLLLPKRMDRKEVSWARRHIAGLSIRR